MQTCRKCVMNETDPGINFNSEGICNHCSEFDSHVKKLKLNKISNLINTIKNKSKSKKYDCVVGVSGGVDSSYLLHYAVVAGLRVLAVHVDSGWNSEIAVRNIHNMCNKLGVDLETLVIDWTTMRELQRSYMFSGLANLDVPQDHAFIAGNYQFAKKRKIKYLLVGTNFANESVTPQWGYTNLDFKNINNIFKRFKRFGNLSKYPHFSILKYIYYRISIKRIQLLNYMDYKKENALNLLEREYQFEYYGGKHYESRFTKFFQSYYLPTKFNQDKRLIHLSNLILNGEIRREEALEIIKNPSYDREIIKEIKYVLNKLDISETEWEEIMRSPNKIESEYKNNSNLIKFLTTISQKLF